ncbi:trichome birefringence [Thalictrum thalictroides]|uniref:Trichome birefringence n=1 Tax=Thalictrum thalictroides TaxID=46969 RepID=A0A7J6V075_THATH|nr:trichome birefringence [Thalictrum thalictroides]
MADLAKQIYAGGGGGSFISDFKSLFSIIRTRRTMVFAYGFMFTVIAFTAFIAFSPSENSSSPWFNNIFSSSSSSSSTTTIPSDGSQFSSFFSYLFPNSSQPIVVQTNPNTTRSFNSTTQQQKQVPPLNQTITTSTPLLQQNQTVHKPLLKQPQLNQTVNATGSLSGSSGLKDKESSNNETLVKGVAEQNRVSNYTSSLLKQSKSNTSTSNTDSAANSTTKGGKLKFNKGNISISVANTTTKDDYLMYNHKLRWQPKGCNIPRLNGKDMLELLKGKRLVFVGDSLNRNMWESLICILRNSVSDKSKVFEASGRREFRTDNSYLFIFKDYNCTVEFFRSPFLVQEWEMPETNGLKKETLRLDLVEKSSSKYKDADYIVFNTGHWWTHEKTSKGKDYYQEGSHVYGNLNVVEAFRKALTTWARWVDANINPKKSLVLFRGYSASHFQ